MKTGILYVESRPSSPDLLEEYHTWYDEVHLGEVLALDGIVAARRLAPVADAGPFVAIYELEAEDLTAVVADLMNAVADGRVAMSSAIQTEPMPAIRLLETTTERLRQPVPR